MQNFELEQNFYQEISLDYSLKAYLDEIGKYPLLNKEEEQELFKKIKNGDKEARDLFIKSNLRLVVSIAKNYYGRGIDFSDIVQEGNLGLIKAIEMFDIEKGYKFSTYATFWIKKSISTICADLSKSVRYPLKTYDLIRKYKAIEIKLENYLHRTPTIEEMSVEMQIPLEQVVNLHNHCLESISFDKEINGDCSCTIGELTPSDFNLEEEYIKKDTLLKLKELISSANIKPENLEILFLRYEKNMGLREIGRIYNIGHQNVTSKLNSSINKIKKLNRYRKLITYN